MSDQSSAHGSQEEGSQAAQPAGNAVQTRPDRRKKNENIPSVMFETPEIIQSQRNNMFKLCFMKTMYYVKKAKNTGCNRWRKLRVDFIPSINIETAVEECTCNLYENANEN